MEIFRLCVVVAGLWNINVINEWAKVFDITLVKQPYSEIEKSCSDQVVGLSENSQPMQSRYAAAKQIGIMAERVKDKINGQIFDRARQLCQDYESEVRLLQADEVIQKIYRSINNDICENILLEKIFELVYDPEIKIKVSSIKLQVEILDYQKNVQKRSKIANLFSEILQLVNEDVVKVMSFSQAKIISKLDTLVTKNNVILTSFLNFYKEVARSKNPEIKQNFQFNLPGMISQIDIKLFTSFRHQFLPQYCDENELVRLYWVTVIMDVADLIGPEESIRHFSGPVRELIENETYRDTLEIIINNLARLFKTFFQYNANTKPPSNAKNSKKEEYVPTIFDHVSNLFESLLQINDWRIRDVYLREIDEISQYYKADDIYELYINMIIAIVIRGNQQIKKRGGKMLATFVPRLHSQEKRKQTMKKIYESFYKDSNFQEKQIFLYFVSEALTNFSRASLRFFVLNQTQSLSEDKVIAVKYELAKLLPGIYDAIMKDDDIILEKFKLVKKSQDNIKDDRLKNILMLANNKINTNIKSQNYQNDLTDLYEKNKKLEEELLSGDDSKNLDELYNMSSVSAGKGHAHGKNKLKAIDLPYSFGISDKRITGRHNGVSDNRTPQSLSHQSSQNSTFYNSKVKSKVDSSQHSIRGNSNTNRPRKIASDHDLMSRESLNKPRLKKASDNVDFGSGSKKSVNTKSSNSYNKITYHESDKSIDIKHNRDSSNRDSSKTRNKSNVVDKRPPTEKQTRYKK